MSGKTLRLLGATLEAPACRSIAMLRTLTQLLPDGEAKMLQVFTPGALDVPTGCLLMRLALALGAGGGGDGGLGGIADG